MTPECLKDWLRLIASGELVPTSTFVDVVAAASLALQPLVGVRRLRTGNAHEGSCVMYGPTRGHAVDLAAQLQHKCFHGIASTLDGDVSIVFLGNMIDGGDRSVETLFLVLATLACLGPDRVVVLRGAHEHLFPSFPEDDMGQLVCRMSTELNVRELQRNGATPTLTSIVRDLFHQLPIACIVNDHYFCVAGGISHLCRRVEDIERVFQERTTGAHNAALTQLLWNEPMDDDDAYTLPRDTQFASCEERQGAFVFGFQAACNFLRRNAPLRSIVRGNRYTSNRLSEGRNRCGRPWHYQHAPFDPGYRLFACNPSNGLPSVVSLFSAPSFCDANHNRGACAIAQKDALVVDAFDKVPDRPIQFPAHHRNAFAWSLPLLWRHATAVASGMLSAEPDGGCNEAPVASEEAAAAEREDLRYEGIRRRMALLAKLCVSHGHKLPLIDDAST